MAQKFIKNLDQVKIQTDLWIVKAQEIKLDHFRSAVWALFRTILRSTPQWSGKAVANWNIGIGAPDFTVDEQVGEGGGVKTFSKGSKFEPLHVGVPGWILYAENMNKYKVRKILTNTKVYISNGVTGDTDHGHSSEHYLSDLQSQTYWAQKLRSVNMPYETVAEVVISESWRAMLSDKSGLRGREGLLS